MSNLLQSTHHINANMDSIAQDLARFYDDPLGFVMWAYPWGQEGTPLAEAEGPRNWQADQLRRIGFEVAKRGFNGKDPVDPLKFATTSGHGIGKSALTAWIGHWVISTRPFSRGVVTANTSDQLRTKTWAELAKWHGMFLLKDMFVYHASRGNMCYYQKDHPQNWRFDAQTCKEENSEAFAGLHAATSTPWFLFDEGSGIPDKIYEVAQGGLTDGEPMWFLFGNPTRNTGFFRECFRNQSHRWITNSVDSRTVPGAINTTLAEQWAEDYGEDSDFFKVRVKGEFPSAASSQLIPTDSIERAAGKHLPTSDYGHAPKVLGVDVARYGDDKSTIYLRQGLAMKKIEEYRSLSLMDLADRVMQAEDETRCNYVFIDVGMGAGVIDRLRQLGRSPVEVNFGGKSSDKQCYNKRAEMWWMVKKWLDLGGAIPQDKDLVADLISQEYFFRGEKIQLVAKDDMKKIHGRSPDDGDGVALTFAGGLHAPKTENIWVPQRKKIITEYDIFA